MRRLAAYDRQQILNRAADLLEDACDDVARTISLEEGKPLSEALGEARRTPDLIRLAASEGARMHGETLPLDAAAGAEGKLGFTLRVPCGVVVAIAPFNYPLLLVAHKVAPALAAGNAVVLKPASQTPLTALKLTELLLEAGLPTNALQTITGSGGELGPSLCADERVRKISFTGSVDVGRTIAAAAGVKKLSLELGANCPVIVLPDADLDEVAAAQVRARLRLHALEFAGLLVDAPVRGTGDEHRRHVDDGTGVQPHFGREGRVRLQAVRIQPALEAGAAELGHRHPRQRAGDGGRQGRADQQDRGLPEGGQGAGACAAQRQDDAVRR